MLRSMLAAALVSLTACSPCLAQSPATATGTDQSQTVTPTPNQTRSTSTTPAAKKVWTNENLSDAAGKVSVVGDKRNQKYTTTADKPADPATVSRIRESLQKLQSQLDSVNQQLVSFKEFQEGETVVKADSEIPQGYTRVPVNQQIPVLQEKKKKLQGQIDDLLDEARKKGVPPGQLR